MQLLIGRGYGNLQKSLNTSLHKLILIDIMLTVSLQTNNL